VTCGVTACVSETASGGEDRPGAGLRDDAGADRGTRLDPIACVMRS
jgi:hypothetical protein